MKNLITTLSIVITAFTASFAQTNPAPTPNANAPEIKFEKTTFDFGTIPEGPDAVATYTFTNVGKEPLIINDVVRTCGCTNTNWPKEPILPGKTAVITATYSTQGRVGTFTKSITVKSNAKEATMGLTFTGAVKAAAPVTDAPKPAQQINLQDKH